MELRTERLALRDYVESDWRRVHEYRTNPLYARYYPEEKCTEQEARDFLAMVMGWAAEAPRKKYQLAILRASDGLLIGSVGARGSSESRFGSEAEFGCEIDPNHWRQGYAVEAGRAVIGFAFDEMKVHRVFARTFAENQPAAQLAEKLGMRLEGCLRERRYFKGRWWDHLFYGILEQEWHGGGQPPRQA
jgi:RimJ/RimL family protein N-acetyltransferase